MWNYAPPEGEGSAREATLEFVHGSAKKATIWRVDSGHGDVRGVYAKMGSPRYPTQAQIAELRKAAAFVPEKRKIDGGRLTLELPAQGLAVVEVE